MDLFFSENGWISKYQNDVRNRITRDMWENDEVREYLDYADAILLNIDVIKEELTEKVITEKMWQTQVFSHNDI